MMATDDDTCNNGRTINLQWVLVINWKKRKTERGSEDRRLVAEFWKRCINIYMLGGGGGEWGHWGGMRRKQLSVRAQDDESRSRLPITGLTDTERPEGVRTHNFR